VFQGKVVKAAPGVIAWRLESSPCLAAINSRRTRTPAQPAFSMLQQDDDATGDSGNVELSIAVEIAHRYRERIAADGIVHGGMEGAGALAKQHADAGAGGVGHDYVQHAVAVEIAYFDLERDLKQVCSAITALQGVSNNGRGITARLSGRTMSASARKRITVAQKVRWAKWRAAQRKKTA